MNKQQSITLFNDELKEEKTHKREFLKRIEEIMPWGELEELVRPCYYEGKRGNKPYGLELMLRIHLLQNLYNLSDEGTRNEIIDSRAFSDFCEVESSNQIPGACQEFCVNASANFPIFFHSHWPLYMVHKVKVATAFILTFTLCTIYI